jgi:hypothetical protein
MLKALIAGTGTPEELADLAQRRMRRKRAALGEALTGRVTAHHRFLLAQLLHHVDFLDAPSLVSHLTVRCDRRPRAGASERSERPCRARRRTLVWFGGCPRAAGAKVVLPRLGRHLR